MCVQITHTSLSTGAVSMVCLINIFCSKFFSFSNNLNISSHLRLTRYKQWNVKEHFNWERNIFDWVHGGDDDDYHNDK